MTNYDDFKLAVESLSGGKNTVLLDDVGMPSVMVAIPRYRSSELSASLESRIHPAFVVGGKVHNAAYISKYINFVKNGRAYSLPLADPSGTISYDDSIVACRAKGAGWGLTPAPLWSAVALWCKQNGTQPHGNNWHGGDSTYKHERGIVTYREDAQDCRTATGSGPVTWNHDYTPSGIADLYGNVSEWCAGVRLVRGEIQVIPNADSILHQVDLGPSSAHWKAISTEGELVEPSAPNTLKLDYQEGEWQVATGIHNPLDDARPGLFCSMTWNEQELPHGVPSLLKELTLFPADAAADGYREDYIFANNVQEERMLLRGGNWTSAVHAGVFYSAIDAKRDRILPRLGFRSAYYSSINPGK